MIYCDKKLAVCILTYNRKDLLKKTIQSVLCSNFKDYRIYVFNDNSHDGTNEYLDLLSNKNLIHEIRNKNNLGQFSNANSVIDKINAEYCMFLHDDDTISKEHIGDLIGLADKDLDIAIVGSFYNIVDKNFNIIKVVDYPYLKKDTIFTSENYFYHNLRGLTFTWSGSLIRMSKIKNLRFEFGTYSSADSPFLIKLTSGNKIGFVPKPSVYYMATSDRLTQSKLVDFSNRFECWIKIFNLYEDIFNENGYDDDYFFQLKKRNTKNLFSLLISNCPNFKYFFKILNSRHFNILFLSLKDQSRIAYKFLKLLINKKNK